MSSCLSGGGRTYGFELDIMKSTSSSPSIRSSSHSSSPSSTLSDSSNAPITISTKRPRTPRKRPNQTYNEAAALLSSIYPNIFSTKSLRKLRQHPRPYDSFSEPPELLPGLPALSDAGFLIRDTPMMNSATHFEPKRVNFHKNTCQSPPSIDFHEPSSPGLIEDDDFDAESILDEEVEEGIDSIMGNLSMDNDNNDKSAGDSSSHNAFINPYLGSLMGFGLGGRPEFGFGLRLHGRGIRRALRRTDDWDWWRSPTVAIRDIVPKFKKLSATEEKKTKKKAVNKEEKKDLEATSTKTTSTTTTTSSNQENLKPSLGLKLDYEDVLNLWSDRGCPFSDGSPESPESFARLAHIDLSPEAGGGSGVREAIVQRYKEKRRSRLFSKKIRYQVRKVNADRRPRMKASGRFVRKPSLLHEGTEEESQ